LVQRVIGGRRPSALWGQLEAALDHLRSSLQIFQERHDQHGAACTLVHLGEATGAQGRHRDAIEQIAQGLKVFGERGDLRWEGKALISLGEQLAEAGEAAAAEAAWRDAIGRLGPLGVPEAARAKALLDQGALPPR
jgi:tetratricopeptide (TPR) repeat protein